MKNRKLGFSLLAGLSCFFVFPAISLAQSPDARQESMDRSQKIARFDMAASYNVSHGLALTARVINKQYQDAYGYAALGPTYFFGMKYTFAGRN